MGDDIGLGSVTVCRLSPFYGHRRHTHHCTLHYGKNQNKPQPELMSSPHNNITLDPTKIFEIPALLPQHQMRLQKSFSPIMHTLHIAKLY